MIVVILPSIVAAGMNVKGEITELGSVTASKSAETPQNPYEARKQNSDEGTSPICLASSSCMIYPIISKF